MSKSSDVLAGNRRGAKILIDGEAQDWDICFQMQEDNEAGAGGDERDTVRRDKAREKKESDESAKVDSRLD